jgi:hypothetical protein
MSSGSQSFPPFSVHPVSFCRLLSAIVVRISCCHVVLGLALRLRPACNSSSCLGRRTSSSLLTWPYRIVSFVMSSTKDRAMAQVVSRRPLTAEARVRARINPCGICGGQNGTGTGFSPGSSVFPCQYHSTVALQTHIIWGMRNMLT